MATFAGHWGPEEFIDRRGRARADADVYVYTVGTTTPVTLYANRTKSATITNPLPKGVGDGTAGLDAKGNGDFYAEPGEYRMVVKLGGASVFDDRISVDLDALEQEAVFVDVTRSPYNALGDGTTDDLASLQTADTAASVTGASLYFPSGTYRVAANVTLASPCRFAKGAKLKPAAGVTVTLAATVEAGLSQIFDISANGSVAFSGDKQPVVFPEWWGAANGIESTAAIKAASRSGAKIVQFTAASYLFSSRIDCESVAWHGNVEGIGTTLTATAAGACVRFGAGVTPKSAVYGSGGTIVSGSIQAMNFNGAGVSDAGNVVNTYALVFIDLCGNFQMRDVRVYGCLANGIAIHQSQNSSFDDVTSQNHGVAGLVLDHGCGGLYFKRYELAANAVGLQIDENYGTGPYTSPRDLFFGKGIIEYSTSADARITAGNEIVFDRLRCGSNSALVEITAPARVTFRDPAFYGGTATAAIHQNHTDSVVEVRGDIVVSVPHSSWWEHVAGTGVLEYPGLAMGNVLTISTFSGAGDHRLIDRIGHESTWHVLGAANEPAYQNSWTVGAGSVTPAFRRDGQYVRWRGYVSGGASGTVLCTVPDDYRPINSVFAKLLMSSGGLGYAAITTSGDVILNQISGSLTTGAFLEDLSWAVD